MNHPGLLSFPCLLLVGMLLMSVSVYPAMAAEAINEEFNPAPAYDDAEQDTPAVEADGPDSCPGCNAAHPAALAASEPRGSSSVTIREIEPGSLPVTDGTAPGGALPTAGGVTTMQTGGILLTIQDPLIERELSAGVSALDLASPDEELAAEFIRMSSRGYDLTSESEHRYESLVTADDFRTADSEQRAGLEREGFTFLSADTLRSYLDVTYYTFTNSTTRSKFLVLAIQRIDQAGNPIGERELAVSPEYSAPDSFARADSAGVSVTSGRSCISEWLALVLAINGIVARLVYTEGPANLINLAIVKCMKVLINGDPEHDGDIIMRKKFSDLHAAAVIGKTVFGTDNIFAPLFYAAYKLGVCEGWWDPMGGPDVFMWDYQYRFSNEDAGREAPVFLNDRVVLRLYADTVTDPSARWVLVSNTGLTRKDTVSMVTDNGTFQAWLFEAGETGHRNITLRYETSMPVPASIGAPRYNITLNVTPGTWKIETVDRTDDSKGTGMYSSLVIDKAGTPHISYLAPSAGGVKYATRKGNSWETTTVSGSRDTWRTSIDLSPEGYPAFSYADNAWNIGDLKFAHWDGKTWHWEYIDKPRNGLTDIRRIGLYNSFKFDSDGNPHVAYNSAMVFGNLMYATIKNGAWTPVKVDTKCWACDTGYNPSLALKTDGRASIAYRTGKPYTILMFAEEGTDGGWVKTEVDTGGFLGATGHFASLALDSRGNPHISYYDDYGQKLRYAYRNESGTWFLETVDDGGNVGPWNSLVLDASDLPRISYEDITNGYLKYAVLDNETGTWVIRTIDRDGNVGACTSMALDPQGHSCISYLDYTHKALKFACEDYHHVVPLGPTPTNTPTPTPTVTLTPTETVTPTPTETSTPVPTPTVSPTMTESPSPTLSPAPSPTDTPAPPQTTAPVKQRTATQATSPSAGYSSGMPAGDTGGSVASISPGTPAGTAITYSFDYPSLSNPLTVDRVSLVPGQAVPESRCTVRQESPLPDFRLNGGPALYNDIEISWINPSAISEARISFDVTKTWLDANHIDPADVVLMRQHNLVWAELPTTFDRQEGGRYYYTATTPGFSYFAVTDKKTAAAARITATMTATPATITTPAPVVAVTSSSTPVPARAAAVHARALLTATETPVPAPHVAEPETGLPMPWIAVAALISMLGIAGFFIGRRLWWEHQNPALFRDYD
jgi:hypothetical protein